MRAVIAILLLAFQAGQTADRRECREGSEPLPREGLASVKPGELRGRVESCSAPRLPGNFCGQGTVLVEVEVDEEGVVRCARPLTNDHPLMRGAAVEAAMRWRFKPLVVDGGAKPYRGSLIMPVHWDGTEMAERCPEGKRAPKDGVRRTRN